VSWIERIALRLLSGRSRSLEGLRRARAVKVEGRILTDDHVPSLVGSDRAAIVTSALLRPSLTDHVVRRFDHLAGPEGAWEVHEPAYEVLAVLQARGPLLIETGSGRVLIPQGDLDVRYVAPLDSHPTRLDTVPEPFEGAAVASEGPTFFSQRFLRKGDAITLMATVRPRRDDGFQPYRTAPRPGSEFEVDVHAETPVLFEEELQPEP